MAAIAAVAAAFASSSAPAQASDPLYPTLLGCIGEDATTGCATTLAAGNNAMGRVVKVVVAPDGTDAYGISENFGQGSDENALLHFRRAVDGTLTFVDCVADIGGYGCTSLPAGVDALLGPNDLVVSPDGRDLYLTTYGEGEYGYESNVSHFRIGADGAVTYADCFGDGAGCTQEPENILDAADALAISPDGTSVYVAATQWSDITHMARDPATGKLTFADCIGGFEQTCTGEANQPCTSGSCSGTDLSDPHGLLVDSANHSVYVLATNSITEFRMGSGGRLSWGGCVDWYGGYCERLPTGVYMGDPGAITQSADGSNIYVSANGGQDYLGEQAELVHFQARPDGSLAFSDCYGQGGDGCTALPAAPQNGSAFPGNALNGAKALQVLPGGSWLHLFGDGSVALFSLAADGSMSYTDCVGDGTACIPPLLAGNAPTFAPDGRNAYSAGYNLFWEVGFGSTPPAFGGGALPTVSTEPAGNVSPVAASPRATIWQSPDDFQYLFQWGTTTSYGNSSGWGLGPASNRAQTFDGSIWNLTPDTLYHFRVVVRTPQGIVYGDDATFTTTSAPGWQPPVPQSPGASVSGVDGTSATAIAQINPEGSPTTYRLEYGTTTSYGSEAPSGGGSVPGDQNWRWVAFPIHGLAPATTYHFRLVAQNAGGTFTSPDSTFATASGPLPPAPPAAFTLAASQVTDTTAQLNGLVNPYGTATTYHFDYGVGINPDHSTTPVAGGSDGAEHAVATTISGLTANTTYYFRIRAQNGAGADVGGGQVSFTTAATGQGGAGSGGGTGGGSGGGGGSAGGGTGGGPGGGGTGGGSGGGGPGGGGTPPPVSSSGPASSVAAAPAPAPGSFAAPLLPVTLSPDSTARAADRLVIRDDTRALQAQVDLALLRRRGRQRIVMLMPRAGALTAQVYGRKLIRTGRAWRPARGPMTLLAGASRTLPAGWQFELVLRVTPAGRRLLQRDGTHLQLFTPVSFAPR